MNTNMLRYTSRRGVELRYVTAHFRDLQGLRTAPMWAALLLLAGVAACSDLTRGRFAAMLTIVLLSLGWLAWSRRWYERRYGLVRDPEPVVSSGIISIMHPETNPRVAGSNSEFRAVYFLLIALWMIPMLFSRFDKRMDGDFSLMFVMLIVLPKCFYSASGNTLIRLRRVLSIVGSIFICVMFPSYLFSWLGKWPYVAAVCATLLLLDLFDHWLFTRLLNGESAEVCYE